MSTKYLVVTKVETGTPAGAETKTPGRKSQKITFKEVNEQTVMVRGVLKEVKSNSPERVRNLWDTYVSEEGTFKGDSLYNNLVVGDVVGGSIESHEVEQYTIPGSERTSNRYTAVVFDNEDVHAYFEKQGHPIVEETKVITTVSGINKQLSDLVKQ